MEPKKRILVVDDDLQNRKSHYSNVFDQKYEVGYTEDADLIYDSIKEFRADLYIIDLDLSGFTDPKTNLPLQVQSILATIGNNKPIILLSGNYRQLMNEDRLTPIIQNSVEEGYNICSFFVWEEITKASNPEKENYRSAIYSKIDFMINKDRLPYDFGIVCALETELKPFMEKAVPEATLDFTIAGIRYQRGLLRTRSGQELHFVAAYSSYMGSVDAGIITTDMVTRFNVENIYMIGVCGGRESEGVKIGDIIIPSESVAYQRGKLTDSGFSVDVNNAKPKEGGLIRCDIANDIISQLFQDYNTEFLKREHKTLSLQQPGVNYHVMACADYVIDKEGELDVIAKAIGQRKLCAVDMESYAIFRVGELLDIKTMVIKSVMDLTNKKSDNYKPYASFMAANYLYQLIYQEIIKFR